MTLTKQAILEVIQEDIKSTEDIVDNAKNSTVAKEYLTHLYFVEKYIDNLEDSIDLEEDKNLSFKNS